LIANSPNLKKLELSTCNGANFSTIFKGVSRLKGLSQLKLCGSGPRLGVTRLTDDDFALLGQLPSLTSLTLLCFEGLTDGVFRHITRALNLESLSILFCQGITGEGLERLWEECPEKAFHRLTRLYLRRMANFDLEGYRQLAMKCTALTHATCDEMDTEKMLAFGLAPQLTHLSLDGTGSRSLGELDAMRCFLRLEDLFLDLPGMDLGNEGEHLSRVIQANPQLRRLALSEDMKSFQPALAAVEERINATLEQRNKKRRRSPDSVDQEGLDRSKRAAKAPLSAESNS
jgi:hypothetical protein